MKRNGTKIYILLHFQMEFRVLDPLAFIMECMLDQLKIRTVNRTKNLKRKNTVSCIGCTEPKGFPQAIVVILIIEITTLDSRWPTRKVCRT
jgi:hypothetical protein